MSFIKFTITIMPTRFESDQVFVNPMICQSHSMYDWVTFNYELVVVKKIKHVFRNNKVDLPLSRVYIPQWGFFVSFALFHSDRVYSFSPNRKFSLKAYWLKCTSTIDTIMHWHSTGHNNNTCTLINFGESE